MVSILFPEVPILKPEVELKPLQIGFVQRIYIVLEWVGHSPDVLRLGLSGPPMNRE